MDSSLKSNIPLTRSMYIGENGKEVDPIEEAYVTSLMVWLEENEGRK